MVNVRPSNTKDDNLKVYPGSIFLYNFVFLPTSFHINLTYNNLVKMKQSNMYVCRMPESARGTPDIY